MRQTKILTITNKLGLHARASAKFVRVCEKFSAEVTVEKDGQIVVGRSLLGLMMLAAGRGSQINISATGDDAAEVLNSLTELITNKFGEPE
ncbi:HPr family phosphocarrier protein [Bartonella sp. DGB1]|uniref:HPr family phosphocarrier protein n=1 Tax=Bartonella sp. DGB1 TaxID=3239807 RepID=UPI00352623E0